jgi:hypothetical protein
MRSRGRSPRDVQASGAGSPFSRAPLCYPARTLAPTGAQRPRFARVRAPFFAAAERLAALRLHVARAHYERPKRRRKIMKMLKTSRKMPAASGIASPAPARRSRLKSTTV